MFRTLHILLTWLLALIMGASFVACSSDPEPNGPVVVNNVNFKVEIHTNGYGVQTRADGPSVDDGTLADDTHEHEVSNATLLLFQAKHGVNDDASTPILYNVYVPNFTLHGDNTYTSGIVNTHLSIPAGNYHVVVVCNMGRVQVATLGDLQQLTTSIIAYGNLQQPHKCRAFAMSSASDLTINIDGTTNMPSEPNGSLVSFAAHVQRLAARIDFSAGSQAQWGNYTLSTTDGNKTIQGYRYAIGKAPIIDYFYLMGVTPINLNTSGEYVLKRVTEDKTFNTTLYLGKEQLGTDGNSTNYVIDPNTQCKGTLTGTKTLRYDNGYANMVANFDACNQGTNQVTQLQTGATDCYTDATDHLVYKKLTYAQENTIVVGADKEKYVTGLLFTGYYHKAGEPQAVRKTYVYYIRHNDPNNSNSDALAMKYGVVRNHVYQVRIKGVNSLGLIMLQVRDWIPLVAPEIDI